MMIWCKGGGPAKLVLPPPRNPRDLFEILRSLRKTIFGHLCLARVQGTSTLVAIKLSELKKMTEIHTHENPRRECDLLARVAGHPHIVTLLGEYECDRYHWAVYELVENGDFFAYVQVHISYSTTSLVPSYQQYIMMHGCIALGCNRHMVR
jgi:serine/threonine protein kinase